MTFAEIERLIERYDAATTALDQAVTARISASLDASFRNLIRELERQYPTWASQGSLYASQRRLLLVNELGGLLEVIKPEDAAQYQALLQEALQLSHTTGATLADELIRTTDPGYPLADFTTIPIEAAVAQARDGVGRLYRYSDEFRTTASSVVEQGLIQGWGTKRVQGVLEKELGVTKAKAETLARTEILSALNTASQERYQRAGVEWVQVFLTPAEANCPFCIARHGNIYEAGAISVPFHPRCRCLIAPSKARWQQQGLTDDAAVEASRARIVAEFEAQGGRLDAGPTSWEKKAGLTAAPTPVWKPGDAIAAAPVAARAGAGAQQPEAPPKANQAYFDKWADSYKDAPPLFKRVLDKLDYPEEIASDGTEGAYHRSGQIHMGTFAAGVGRADSVWRHEYGHYVDRLIGTAQGGAGSPMGYISSSPDGTKAMQSDMRALNKANKGVSALSQGDGENSFKILGDDDQYRAMLDNADPVFSKLNEVLEQAMPEDIRRTRANIYSAINYKDPYSFLSVADRAIATRYEGKNTLLAADLSGAITKNNVGYGHSDAYYSQKGYRETEAYANVFSMLSSGDELELMVARHIAPAYTQFVLDTLENL